MRGMSSRGLALGPVLAGSRPCGCMAPVQKRRKRALHTPGEYQGAPMQTPIILACASPLSFNHDRVLLFLCTRKGDTLDEIMFGKK